jgi:hypothetical protein
MINKIPEYIPENQIQRLISDIYYMKMEINSNYKTYSAVEIHDLAEERLNKKKELRRLEKLRDRKNKILKLKSKI